HQTPMSRIWSSTAWLAYTCRLLRRECRSTRAPSTSPRAGMPPLPILRLAASLLLSATAFTASAQGNAEAGKNKAYTCTGCQGIAGYKNVYPHYHVPKIGGQNYEYLVTALTE